MKKILFINTLIFSFFLTISSASSQGNYVKGYYITEQSDTVSTYINDKNWDKNPKEIQVKNSLEDKKNHNIKISEIKSFSLISGDLFIREKINIDKSSFIINYREQGEKSIVVTDTVFLRVLVKGPINLFYLKDENAKEHFYIQKQNMKPQELLLRRYKQEVNGKFVLMESPLYKNLLTGYLADCASLKDKADRIDYSLSKFKEIVEQYNRCKGNTEEAYVPSKKEKIDYRMGAILGLSKTNLTFAGEGQEELINTKFHSPVSYTFGLGLDIVMPRQHQRWSIYNEILYKPYTAMGHYEEIRSSEYYSKTDFQFGFNYLGLGNMIRYQLSAQNIRPFINIGIANNFSLKSTNNKEMVSKFYSDESSESSLGIADLRNYEQAFLIGAGIMNKRIKGEVRLELGNGFSKFISLESKKNMLSFIVGYNLN